MKEFTPEERRKWLDSLPAIPSSAALLLENDQGQLLVVKASYRSYWTMPGGVVDEGETPKEAAIRETKEEVGLVFTSDEVTFRGVVLRRNDPFRNIYKFIFEAPFMTRYVNSISLSGPEIEAYSFVSKDEVLNDKSLYSADALKWASDSIFPYDEYDKV